MELTLEDRRRIYEEEKARLESHRDVVAPRKQSTPMGFFLGAICIGVIVPLGIFVTAMNWTANHNRTPTRPAVQEVRTKLFVEPTGAVRIWMMLGKSEWPLHAGT